jgi:hypothetical protein
MQIFEPRWEWERGRNGRARKGEMRRRRIVLSFAVSLS